uniref:hypothetical protein n=1 Tax=Providencia rustigianii TaxID=158850 RepID=UPI00223EFBCC
RVWRRLLENSLSAKVSCWLIRLLILGSGYNTMISHLGLIRTFLNTKIIVDTLAFSSMSASVFAVNVGKCIATFTGFLKYVLFRFLFFIYKGISIWLLKN